MVKKKRLLLTDRQCSLFLKDMREFGYVVTFDEIRRIADEVHAGTASESNPIAKIMIDQIDEAMAHLRRSYGTS